MKINFIKINTCEHSQYTKITYQHFFNLGSSFFDRHFWRFGYSIFNHICCSDAGNGWSGRNGRSSKRSMTTAVPHNSKIRRRQMPKIGWCELLVKRQQNQLVGSRRPMKMACLSDLQTQNGQTTLSKTTKQGSKRFELTLGCRRNVVSARLLFNTLL